MADKYVLAADGRTPVLEPNLLTWAQWFEHAPRRVAHAIGSGDVRISTTFLGIDHRFGLAGEERDPILWETMIFGGPLDGYQERYTSYDAAVAGHAKALTLVTATDPAMQLTHAT